MKKLAGTTWKADGAASILRRLHTGMIRPVLGYSIAAWGNTTKANLNRVSKVQHQAACIMTWSMKPTPIIAAGNPPGISHHFHTWTKPQPPKAAPVQNTED
ncbi:reverse transcriptase-like protein [Elysia marginata]|uniref:Reverse transcriptase-like protein n=1 Tax=Elysia marginata TaxID=1093978 RepID=A0AAV4II49_9GAST|nr:reverse transcriptase-like protein [Elysia marginata]